MEFISKNKLEIERKNNQIISIDFQLKLKEYKIRLNMNKKRVELKN